MPPVERFIQATAVIDEHDRQRSTEETCPFDGGHGGLFPIQLIQGLSVKILYCLIRYIFQLKAMLYGFLRRRVDDFSKQTVPLIVHGQQLVGNSVFRDKLVLLRRILLRTIPGHHVHIAISTVRPHRLARLFLNQISISSNAVKLRDLVLFQCACTSFRYRNQIRLLTSKALASISAKPLADASTISLNFPSGKFSSCNRYSSFQGP